MSDVGGGDDSAPRSRKCLPPAALPAARKPPDVSVAWAKSLLVGLAATAWSLAPAPVRAEQVGGGQLDRSVDAWLDEPSELADPERLAPDADVASPAIAAPEPTTLSYPPALRGATTINEPTHGGAIDGRPAGSPLVDASVAPAQASQPTALLNLGATARGSRTPAVNRRPTSLVAGGVAAGTLASVPYMIGDTGAGTCIGFDGVLNAELSHPTLACGRLNIAENNSPLPANRFYMSYRHFENASPISVFQFGEAYNIDRWTLANETTFWGGLASWEIRLPIAYQVPRDIISAFDQNTGFADLIADPNREADLGNLSLITKFLLLEGSDYVVSGGLGVTVPTAHDVRYRLAFRGEVDTDFPGLTYDSITAIDAQFDNETVYLAPFLSWLYAPGGSPWFHHGFLQIETAANPSTVTTTAIGTNTFLFNGVPFGFFDYVTGPGPFAPSPVDVELHAQTLMRLNVGTGYELGRNPRGTFVQRLVGLAELHYTTTLQDAKLSEIPITEFAFNAPPDLQELKVGNASNRVDILNAALGLQADMGPFIVTNGFVVPLREGPDRGFDFEYNLQVQLPY
jgi:hypothetical protein